jgi:hypothetical protein
MAFERTVKNSSSSPVLKVLAEKEFDVGASPTRVLELLDVAVG